MGSAIETSVHICNLEGNVKGISEIACKKEEKENDFLISHISKAFESRLDQTQSITNEHLINSHALSIYLWHSATTSFN